MAFVINIAYGDMLGQICQTGDARDNNTSEVEESSTAVAASESLVFHSLAFV